LRYAAAVTSISSDADPEAGLSDPFRLSITPTPGDIDELGHVSNQVYLRYILDAATRHSHAVGLDHAAYLRIGSVFVVRRQTIDYLAPTYAGEDLVVTTWIAEWSAVTSVRRTSLLRIADGREVAKAETLWAMVATAGGRPRRIPPEVRAMFARKARA
jgi:acyl-CoA thioester hydrolase